MRLALVSSLEATQLVISIAEKLMNGDWDTHRIDR
jgi:hypothetical protein